MSERNPYSGRGAPVSGERLVGRTAILKRLVNRITNTSHCSVVGLPRMGKTSIVREAVRIAQRDSSDLVGGYITLDAISGPIHAYNRILSEIKPYYENMSVIDSQNHDDVYESFLRDLRNLSRRGQRTVLIIDEMDAIIRDGFPDAQVFISRIREIANDRDRYGVSFLFVSRRSLDMIQGVVDTSTLAGLCEVVYLPPLERDGLQELLNRSWVEIAPGAEDALWEQTGGHPYLAEVVMCEALELSSDCIDDGIIENAQHIQAHEFTNQYKQIEHLLSYNEMFDALCELTVGPSWRQITPHTISVLKHYGLLKSASGTGNESMSLHLRYYLESVNRLTPSWVLLGDTEKSLRLFIYDKMYSKYENSWSKIIQNKKPDLYESLCKLRDREQRLFGDAASEFLLDYTYISELKELIFMEWELCRSQLGGSKSEWETKFQRILKVRNPMAHHRQVPHGDIYDAEEECKYIISRLM